MKRIGIMGGTFNPIHMGHLLLAEWAKDAQKLDEVWMMPTGCSYMKQEQGEVSPMQRYEMACLAVKDNEGLFCCDMEVKREGYTYSYETFEQLKASYPDTHFYFIFGADCLFSIERWKFPERIFASCSILAAVRGDVSMEEMTAKRDELVQKYGADIILLPFLQLELSSTLIRKRVAKGESIRYLVPDQVIAYIEEKGFYKDEID